MELLIGIIILVTLLSLAVRYPVWTIPGVIAAVVAWHA